jgi:hypothetical protein
MPTTAGSQLLEGHMAKQDAFMVKKLREAGAIMLAKANLSEFAGSGGSVSGATDPAIVKAGSVPNGSSSAGGHIRRKIHTSFCTVLPDRAAARGRRLLPLSHNLAWAPIPADLSVAHRQPTELSV